MPEVSNRTTRKRRRVLDSVVPDTPEAPLPPGTSSQRWAAWGVHLFTASGVWAGVLAWEAAAAGDARRSFFWMMIAVFIDSVDGTLARWCEVKRHAPWVDGRRLDDMVDFFTWVIVPVVAMHLWGLIPGPVWCLPLVCSALGMAHHEAKTDDHCFLGFPSLWNVVALYLWRGGWSTELNGAIVVCLSFLVLVPWRFLYPSQTPVLPVFNMVLMCIWGALVMLSITLSGPTADLCFRWSTVYVVYYLLCSAWLQWRCSRART